MNKIREWILGSCGFRISGSNLLWLINELREKYRLFDVQKIANNQVFFKVDFINAQNIVAFIDKTCYNIDIVGYHGLLPVLFGLKKRLGLVIGGVVMIAMMSVFSNLIVDVKFQTIGDVDTESIKEALYSDNIVTPFSFGRDLKQIEKYIHINFEDIAFVSCVRRGTNLEIKVVSALHYVGDHEERDAIVASVDGTVSRVIVTGGTAVVKAGDKVKQGDTLIIGEINGVKTAASGKVYLSRMISETVRIPTVSVSLERSGNVAQQRHMSIFGFNSVIRGDENTFERYELETDERYVFNGNLLPIKMITSTYYELVEVRKEIDYKENKQLYIERAKYETVGRMLGEYEIMSEVIEEYMDGTDVVLSMLMMVEYEA